MVVLGRFFELARVVGGVFCNLLAHMVGGLDEVVAQVADLGL